MKGILKVFAVLFVISGAADAQATSIYPISEPGSGFCANDEFLCLTQSAIDLPAQSINIGIPGAAAHIQGHDTAIVKPPGADNAFLPKLPPHDDAELNEPASGSSGSVSIAVHEPGSFGLFMAVCLILVIRRMNK